MLENVCRIASDFRTLGRYGVQFCSLANKFVDSTINVGGCRRFESREMAR